MPWMISGTKARRQVLIWRGAAAGLGLFAATLWAMQMPLASPDVRMPQPGAVTRSTPAATGEPAEVPRLEPEAMEDVAARLDHVVGRVAKGPDAPPTTEPPSQTPAAWKYLGAILEPRRRLAVISVDGRQAVIPEGRELNGLTLIEVKPDAIVVNDGTRRIEVPKEARSGPSVAWVTPVPGAGGAGLGGNPAAIAGLRLQNAAMQNQTPGVVAPMDPSMAGFTPEEQAQMRERGIDPGTAARMQRRLEKDRASGRGNRAGTKTTTEDGRVITTTPAQDASQKGGPEAPTQ